MHSVNNKKHIYENGNTFSTPDLNFSISFSPLRSTILLMLLSLAGFSEKASFTQQCQLSVGRTQKPKGRKLMPFTEDTRVCEITTKAQEISYMT